MKGRLLSIILTIIVLSVLSGCSTDSNKNKSLEDKLYQKHNRAVSKDIADEIVDEILTSAKDKNFDNVDKLFSNYAHSNNSNLEKEFNEFCDYCSYDIEEVSGLVDYSEQSNYPSHYLEYYLGYEFKIKGDDTQYLFHVVWIADNENDNSQIGIQSIEILKKDYASAEKYWRNSNKTGFHIIYE